MKTNLKVLAMAALFAWLSEVGYAGPVGPLTIFTAGTPAKASEVNGNFSAVSAAVNANDGRITTLETTVGGGNVTPIGNIVLVPSTATTGNILKGTDPFIHNAGLQNTFIGVNAGNFTMSGFFNTASGFQALQFNTSGFNNTATGGSALLNNTTGNNNAAYGVGALLNNTTGAGNTAIGPSAMQNNTTGSRNIAIGIEAALNLSAGDDNIYIGSQGSAFDSRTIRIGNSAGQTRTFIAGIRGITTDNADAIPVVVDSTGQLGTVSSSRRSKDDIADMGKASSVLMKLRPVTFHYKNDENPRGRTLQYGLVAEEVSQVAPGLVARSADGKIESVYYQFLAPMLVNEVQKQQRTIEAQSSRIASLEKQSAEIAGLKLQFERMSKILAQLERSGLLAAAER